MLLTLIPWWGRALVLALVAAALFGYGWFKGDAHGTEKLTEYIGKEATATVKLAAVRQVVLTKVETKYVDRVKTIVQKGDTIIKEVTKYVTKEDDAGCVIPVGFVRSYNAAVANNPDPAPAGDADRAPAGVPLSTVATTDAFNYSVAWQWRARAEACVEAYEKVRLAK